ncbi:unnamed protein product [Pleuronectes platessa]|uniref:Uncharacterized protein n=1 Tax=Pleuronectes platessa TaxID=8262 RepID=A0A9N7Z5K9_PLEPL|nr:unnamed protein product [Pleuronectes platessa]
MDLAEQAEALRQAMALQGVQLGHHDEALHSIQDKVDQITTALSTLIARLDAAPAVAAQVPAPVQQALPAAQSASAAGTAALEPRIPPPAKYSGDPTPLGLFLKSNDVSLSSSDTSSSDLSLSRR